MADETNTVTTVTTVEAKSDKWSYRLAIVALAFALVGTVGGVIALAVVGKEIPSELAAIATPIVTALAALLGPIKT